MIGCVVHSCWWKYTRILVVLKLVQHSLLRILSIDKRENENKIEEIKCRQLHTHIYISLLNTSTIVRNIRTLISLDLC